MLSQIESILLHLKAACLRCIIDGTSLNLGMIVGLEMVMRDNQCQTSLPLPLLITELCRRARVPFDAKKDVKVIPTSSTDIRRIETECLKDKAAKKKAAPVHTSPVVDTETLPTEAVFPTHTPRPSSIYSAATSMTLSSSTAPLPPRYVYDFGTVEIADMLVDSDMPPPTIGDEVRADEVAAAEFEAETDESLYFFKFNQLNKLIDEVRADEVASAEFEAETDEEQLGVDEETTYDGLTEVEEAMVQSAVQISLLDTSMAGSSGASVDVKPGTNVQDQNVAPGIDAPTDGATL
uniref:Putative plant transposon protein domain-containing protein n=1 Tax=Solanum tuberosum TaxID=4113 RepID=M1DQW7_SOLTU